MAQMFGHIYAQMPAIENRAQNNFFTLQLPLKLAT